MDWKQLAGTLIAKGAPTLGQLIGEFIPVPFGGSLATWALNKLAEALGVEATPEAVDEAINTRPASEVNAAIESAEREAIARWQALADIAKAQADVGTAQVVAVNDAIKAETNARAASGDGLLGQWRGFHAWELTIECPFWSACFIYGIMFGAGSVINELSLATPILTIYFGARFGVLGVHVWQGSNERQAAIKA
jgi:hypothetical protein